MSVLRKAFPEVERFIKTMGTNLCFAYRHFPLVNIHPHAGLAAVSSEAADQQGEYWKMHHLLFENSPNLSLNNIIGLAKEIGLDRERFQEDLQRQDLVDKVQRHFMSGVRSGVNGTPTFYFNGYRFHLDSTYENLMMTAQAILEGVRPAEFVFP